MSSRHSRSARRQTAGEIGEHEYRYPPIDADVVYLWPERQPDAGYPYYPYYDPWFGPHISIGVGGYR